MSEPGRKIRQTALPCPPDDFPLLIGSQENALARIVGGRVLSLVCGQTQAKIPLDGISGRKPVRSIQIRGHPIGFSVKFQSAVQSQSIGRFPAVVLRPDDAMGDRSVQRRNSGKIMRLVPCQPEYPYDKTCQRDQNSLHSRSPASQGKAQTQKNRQADDPKCPAVRIKRQTQAGGKSGSKKHNRAHSEKHLPFRVNTELQLKSLKKILIA